PSSLLTCCRAFHRFFSRVGQIFVSPHVRYAAFVTGDHYLVALGHRLVLVTARRAGFAHSQLRVDEFTGTAFADRNTHAAKHAHHFIFKRINLVVIGHEHFRHESKDDRCCNQPRRRSQEQSGPNPYMTKTDQQVSGSTEPGQKCCDRHGIYEPEMNSLGYARAVSGVNSPRAVSGSAKMKMLGQVHMKVKAMQTA